MYETVFEQAIRTEAETAAHQKLERLIEREGDAGGTRKEPWYFKALVDEAETEIVLRMLALAYLGQTKSAMAPTKETMAQSNRNRNEAQSAVWDEDSMQFDHITRGEEMQYRPTKMRKTGGKE